MAQVYEEEMEQQEQVLYRGFGTQKPGGWLANVFDIRDKVSFSFLFTCSGKLKIMSCQKMYALDHALDLA